MTQVQDSCSAILNQHAKSFRWAAMFLGARARDDAAVAYAFCRIVDDSVDEAPDIETARLQLGQIEEMLDGTRQASPIVAEYMALAERTGMGLLPARDLILGARSDLETVRIADDEDFRTYCYRVAGTVGLMMCAILGVKDKQAHKYAVDLGIAMQMTNICRDVLEDGRRDRVYLPESRLRENGTGAGAVLALTRQQDPGEQVGLSSTVRSVLLEADRYYTRAARGFRYLPMRARLSIMIASRIYRQIGVRLAWNRGCNPLAGRVSVSAGEKLLLTLKVFGSWLLTLYPRDQRLALPCGENVQVRELPN